MGGVRNDSRNDSHHKSDLAIVEQIKRGNENAFESLFKTYYTDLVGFGIKLVNSQPVAEELVQDVFVKLWELRTSLVLRYTLRSYLYAAVRNQALNYLKRHNPEEPWREELDSIKHSHENPTDALHAKDLGVAIEQAIQTLPERRRLVFILHREEHLTYPEIATMLGISINTVETQMVRALKSLRKLLSDYLQ